MENNATPTQDPPPATISHDAEVTTLREEVAAQAAIAAKAKKATQLAETEINRLQLELCQSSDREADIRAKGRKAVKTIQDKLDAEIAAHGRTKEERDKLHEEGIKKETIISALQEAAQKKRN